MLWRLRTVTAFAARYEFDVGIAFFENTDGGNVLLHKTERFFDDCAAFVNNHKRSDALRFEPIARHACAGSRSLLVVAVTEIYVLLGYETLFNEFVNRLYGGKERVFAIHCASAVHFSVNDRCAEWGIFPISADCGNDVLMRHKHERTSA